MNWHKLKNKQCPSCRTPETLTQSLVVDKYECPRCGFHISLERFDSLVSSFYKKTAKFNRADEEQNLRGLSDL